MNNYYPAPEGLTINLKGVGTFNKGRVVYAQPNVDTKYFQEQRQVLILFAQELQNRFAAQGLVDRSYKFEPHATLAKVVTRGKRGRDGGEVIAPEVYEPFKDYDFGAHSIVSLDLASMHKPKAADGYYHCEASIPFID
ncbi:A-kinase anchor protein 7 isoforms alpha and beta [Irineochytrium annulatum]|nr:A-kinase anchor protein 7 isoforms alpha and beta [Irineochytrium annulatum]